VFELYGRISDRIKKLVLPIVLSVLMVFAFVQHCFPTGQIVTDTITSQALKGNKLGDPDTRNITIYLPPGYASSNKLYPVIHLLHGFGGDERSLVGEVGEELAVFLVDSMIESGLAKEMIIVMPNAKNKYGGSFYLNSELTGKYEDYMVYDLVNYIDDNYRTIRDRNARAIGGASMGGYGSITLAMKHPDIFSSVVSLSPPLGFEIIASEMFPEVIRENPDGMPDPGQKAEQYTEYVYALSAALSPNLDNPPFFLDLPFEYPSSGVIESVKQRWLVGDPLTMLSTYSQSLEGLKGIYIDVGDEDLLGFKAAADAFHEELIKLGIDHEYNVYHGDHYALPVERFISALEFLSARLPEPVASSAVSFNDKLISTWGAIKQR
jgi:S-formylglutathione hydrolase FrmB